MMSRTETEKQGAISVAEIKRIFKTDMALSFYKKKNRRKAGGKVQ